MRALPVDPPQAAGLEGLEGTGVAAGPVGRTVAVGALRDEGFILLRRPGAAELSANFLALCRAQGFQPWRVAEVPRRVSHLNLVAAGAGISKVPASMQGVHPHAVAYCALADSPALDAPMPRVWRQASRAGRTAAA